MTTEYSFILAPSGIHGVGVFTTHAIRKDTRLRLFAESEGVRYQESVPSEFERYVFAQDAPRIMCPADFGCMSVGWHVNHADNPNTRTEGYEYIADRDIEAGEEITIDYKTLEPESTA